MKQTYNGWTNYETWNVALWLGNDYGLYQAVREFVKAHRGKVLARTARQFVTEIMPEGTPDFAERGGAARYAAVSWGEIASTLKELGAS